MNIQSPIVTERFWSKVHVTRRKCCWIWLGSKDGLGYGKFRHDRRTQRAHRVAFWLRNGIWPDNACHKCDNPSCCNPDHIFNGSRHDNMRDMVSKGRNRSNSGENHYAAKLTNELVKMMRQEYKLGHMTIEALAQKYGCSFSTAQRTISLKSWRCV